MIKVRSYIYFFLISFLLMSLQNVITQWSQIYQSNSNYNGYFGGLHFINMNTGFVACQDSSIMKTTNSGLNWFSLTGTGNHGLWNIQFTSSNTGYAVGNIGFSNGQFLKTTNSGINWHVTLLPYYIFSMDFVDNNTGYLSDDNGFLHKTTNGGQNWVSINLNSGLYLNYVDFIDLNNGFVVASENQRLLVTTNSGLNWQQKYSPRFSKVQFLNSSTGFGFYNDFNFAILYKTTNNGDGWLNTFQMDSVFIFDVNFINLNTGWVSGSKLFNNSVFYRKIFKTTNSGISWIEQYTGNVSFDSSSCLGVIQMLDSLNGFVSTGFCQVNNNPTVKGRIYKTTNGGGGPIGIEPVYSNIPERYVLNQNYPNPFNPVTKISFEIPVSIAIASTSLIIYDITGKVVSVLVDEELQPGKYEIEWSVDGGAEHFSSGVYFYTLRSGNFKETRKMLMIK